MITKKANLATVLTNVYLTKKEPLCGKANKT